MSAPPPGLRLLQIRVTGPRTISADYTLGGYLRFPWHPRIEPYTGHVTYTLNDQGLVQTQEQSWSISGAEALRATFAPTRGVSDDIRRRVLQDDGPPPQ